MAGPPDPFDGPVPVLVLRRSLGDFQHCVLAISRSLGRLGVPVYAVRQSRHEPATRSRYLAGHLDLDPDADEQGWVDQLMRVDARLSGGVLLAIDDIAAVAVGNHQELLARRFRVPAHPPGITERLASKLGLATVCREFAVPTPETTLLGSPEDAQQFAERFGYPVVLKRDVAWGDAKDTSGPSVLIVDRQTDLPHAYELIRMQSPPEVPNVVAQEYIPGSSESVWMFNGYFSRGSSCRFALTGQKLRQCARGAGQTTLGICTPNESVTEHSIRLMEGLRYTGIVDMGFRFDARDGEYKLLDVNPRVGSTFRLFSAADGTDVVRALYLDQTGHEVPAATPMPARRWVDEPHDAVAALRLVRARQLSLAGWARSVHRVSEFTWWATDDPVPFLAMAASLPIAAARGRSRWGGRISGHDAQRSAAATPTQRSGNGDPQRVVSAHFDRHSGYWRDVYGGDGIGSLVYRERMETTLAWVDQMDIPDGAHALDVGCGAGLLTAELAARKLQVTGCDASPVMAKQAQQTLESRQLTERAQIVRADARQLPFASGTARLVVALGLIPWLSDPQRAVNEMARVLEPGGWLILTADNALRLNALSDPSENPWAAPLRSPYRAFEKRYRRRTAAANAPYYRHSPTQVTEMLTSAGLRPTLQTTVGFGPFTFMGRAVLTDQRSIALDRRLEEYAQRHPRLRRHGWHYMVAARR